MKKILVYIITVFNALGCSAQVPKERPHVQNAAFDKKIVQWLSFSVKTISPADAEKLPNAIFLDAREQSEYDVSHIPNATFIGYKNFDPKTIAHLDKNSPVVVYCSIGYRSEKIGEKLQKMGFNNVHNLYGSIFEWVNTGRPVVTNAGEPTRRLHTFNRQWSKWVDIKNVEKVW